MAKGDRFRSHHEINKDKQISVHSSLERAVAVRAVRDEMRDWGFSQADIDAEVERQFSTN